MNIRRSVAAVIMKCSVLILTMLICALILVSRVNVQSYWRRGDDPDTVERTRAELDSLIHLHHEWFLDTTQGERLILDSAYLRYAHLKGYNLPRAHLVGANLFEADLVAARLQQANLEGADLTGAYLEGAVLAGANLQGANFEVSSLPVIKHIARAYGLKTLIYDSDPSCLVELREEFAKAGFKQQERDIICALNRGDANFLKYIFFDLTSEYGSNLTRPWLIFGFIWLLCFLLYYISTLRAKWSRIRLILPIPIDEVLNHKDFVDSKGSSDIQTNIHIGNLFLKSYSSRIYKWFPMFIRMLWWAAFFSTMSAFNIGFRDINFDKWLRLLPRKEFDLKPYGWIRMVSGFQALCSVYLIGLWILSFAGTPFK